MMKTINRKFFLIVGLLLVLFLLAYVEIALFVRQQSSMIERSRSAALVEHEVKVFEQAFWEARYWERVILAQVHPGAEQRFGCTMAHARAKLLEINSMSLSKDMAAQMGEALELLNRYENAFNRIVQLHTEQRLNHTNLVSKLHTIASNTLLADEPCLLKSLLNLTRFQEEYLTYKRPSQHKALGMVLNSFNARLSDSSLIEQRLKAYIDAYQELLDQSLDIYTRIDGINHQFDHISIEFMALLERISTTAGALSRQESYTAQHLRDRLHCSFAVFVVLGLVLAASIVGIIAVKIVRPLKDLQSVVKRVHSGDVAARFTSKDTDDISLLGCAFNEMLNSLEVNRGKLQVYQQELESKVVRLAASESKYRGLIESARDGLVRIGENGKVELLNPVCTEITGYEPGEVAGLGLKEFLCREDRDKLENLMGLPASAICGLHEFRVRHKDGRHIPVEVTFNPIRGENGAPAMIGIIRDVCERKRSEEEHQRLAQVVRQAMESIILTDKEWRVQYVNPAFERMSGCCREEVMGKTIGAIRAGTYSEIFLRSLEESSEYEDVWTGCATCRKKDGTPYDIESNISAIRDKTGAVISYVVIERDITRELKLEKQLRQAQKMEALGTLAGGIAHDFNNILAAIMGYTEMVQYDLSPTSRLQEYLNHVMKASERARDLVKQILTFSRLQEQERRPIELGSIIKEVLKLLRASLPSTIQIQHHLDSSAKVLADPTQIHQVIMNLCTNAAHAMEEKGGSLDVSLEAVNLDSHAIETHPGLAPGKYLMLTVADTGSGMSHKVLERIFDPYFTTKELGQGTGLGLSVVHGIVQSHGGSITVYSEPGTGTTFRVFLAAIDPLGSKTGTMTRQALCGERKSPPKGKGRILLVDDEPDLMAIGKKMIEQLGYDVTAEMMSQEALQTFRSAPDSFDLIITDQTMPKITGLELARQVQSIRPGMPLILCTGHNNVLARMSAEAVERLGIRAVTMKPFLMSEIAGAISDVLGSDSKCRSLAA